MNRQRVIPWILVCGVVLALLAGSACRRANSVSSLPASVEFPSLPRAFAATLQERRASVAASPGNSDAVRSLAHLYHANRLFAEAHACYDLVARGPSSLTARDHYYLADIAREQGDLPRAQQELRAVVAAEPRYLPARIALAEVLHKSGGADGAAEEFAAVLALVPDHLQAGLGLARIELQRGDEDAAVARLDDLMAAHPESTSGASMLAPILRRRGEVDRADALATLSQTRPEPPPDDPWMTDLFADQFDVRLLGLRAEDLFRTGQAEAAQQLLNRIEEFDPTSAVAPLLRGQAETLAHRDDAAVAQFRIALERGGDAERICPVLTRSLLALGRVNEAAAFLADYHARFPASMPIAKAYAEALVKRGDNPTARVVLEKVVEREPFLRTENMNLAQILWETGERDAAAKCLQRVASSQSDDVASRALLGEYFLGKGDPGSAFPPLEQAFKLTAPNTPVRNSLTVLLVAAFLGAGNESAARGEHREASDFFEKATKANPASAEAHVGLANVCVLMGQYVKAAEALARLATLQPGNPTILLSLGDVHSRNGEPDTARRHWQRALDLTAPGDVNLRKALQVRLSGESKGDLFQ
jgi:tetratricopeptide (TPR) repeat protein